jgi:hypothetical protein
MLPLFISGRRARVEEQTLIAPLLRSAGAGFCRQLLLNVGSSASEPRVNEADSAKKTVTALG